MVCEILNLLKYYHDNKRLADEEFVMRMIDILIDYYQVKYYVKNVFVVNDKKAGNCLYSFITNTLIINLGEFHSKENYEALKDEYFGMYNLLVLKTIIHEMEHVLQEKLKDTSNNTVERKLILLSDPTSFVNLPRNELSKLLFKFQVYKYNIYYNMHYYAAPHERLAIIKSCSDICGISHIEFIQRSSYFKLFNFVNELELNHTINYGYHLKGDYTNSPTLKYLYHINKDNRDIVNNDSSLYDLNMSSEDRLLYGLPLTIDEYKSINNIKDNLVKKYGGKYAKC